MTPPLVTPPHPFRFIAPMPSFELPPARWRDEIHRIEDLGFSAVSISEHLTHGWAIDPLVAMTAAAEASERLRVLSLVLINDLRHPVILHRAIETLQHLSGGRVELGLGAGWRTDDFDAAGIQFDSPAMRIERLAEAVEVLRRLFGDDEVALDGRYYRVHRPARAAAPEQATPPRVLIGGGGRRILELAARFADIVGVHASLPGGILGPDTIADFAADRIETKVGWVREALTAAGRPASAIELQFSTYLCRIGSGPRIGARVRSTFADRLAVHEDLLATSPSILIGSVEECVDLLEERRARFGFSYLRLSDEIDEVAPLVRALAGR